MTVSNIAGLFGIPGDNTIKKLTIDAIRVRELISPEVLQAPEIP